MHKKNLLVSAIIIFSFLIIYSCGKNPAGLFFPFRAGINKHFSADIHAYRYRTARFHKHFHLYGFRDLYRTCGFNIYQHTTPSADSYETDNVYTAANEITNGETQTRSIHVWDDEDGCILT